MSVDVQVDQAALKLKIAELTEALASAKLGMVDVSDQMRAMDAEITRLTKLVAYREVNVVDKGMYRYRAVQGHPVGTPFCPVCEAGGTFIQIVSELSKDGRKYVCPKCKSSFGNNVNVYSLPRDLPQEG